MGYPVQEGLSRREHFQKVADEAVGIISGDRHEQYGSAEKEFARIGAGWSALFGCDISPRQVALAMVWLKVCREDFRHKEDNIVDLIGYALLADESAWD